MVFKNDKQTPGYGFNSQNSSKNPDCRYAIYETAASCSKPMMMRILFLTFLPAAFWLLSFQAPAGITVKGKITDEKGYPLAGAYIIEKGTKRSTLADANGCFHLAVSSSKSVLVFSYIGFTTRMKKVKHQTVINITLKLYTAEMEEAIVTAHPKTIPIKNIPFEPFRLARWPGDTNGIPFPHYFTIPVIGTPVYK